MNTDRIRLERDPEGRIVRAVAYAADEQGLPVPGTEAVLPPFKGFAMDQAADMTGNLSIAWGAHRVRFKEVQS